jgi:hypothetical protein
MPLIFRIFENGRYETSVKKQTLTATFAPVAAAVVYSSPLSLHKEEESKATETRETRETRDEGLLRGGRFAEEAASKHSERLRSKFQ